MNNRKRLVVEHALSLFIEKGIAHTSIQDIIERAGISKGTFYNYFSSKHECICEILEQVRYEATLMRAEFVLGKDPTDYAVLAEQITILSTINRERGLLAIFEEILHSGDAELKKVVMKYRIHELEWLATRFEEVLDMSQHAQAFEAATIFYGMMQHISFTSHMIQQHTLDSKAVTNVCLLYMKDIVRIMTERETNLLDVQLLESYISSLRKVEVSFEEILTQLQQFSELPDKTKAQQEITEALLVEVQLDEKREVVADALIRAFAKEFVTSPYAIEAKEISSVLWYLMKHKKK